MAGKVDYLEEKLRQSTDYYEYETEYTDDGYNYLAIGNSLTMINSIGRGICSTQPDNDYVGLITKYLQDEYGTVVHYAYNYAVWERSAQRNDTLDLLDTYLDSRLDLVTVQLGENVVDLSSFEEDLEALIIYVKDKCPNAEVIVIGDFWSDERNIKRKTAADNQNCEFADLTEIIGIKEYQSKAGTVYFLQDGSTAEVSEAAAAHPGDKGMQYIADKVIEILEM